MKKDLFRRRYFYLSFSGALLCGLFITLVDYLLAKEGVINLKQPLTYWDKLAFALSVLVAFLAPMGANWLIIRRAYKKGLLDRAISASIKGAGQVSEKEKYSHFLREITQADRLNPLLLEIDGPVFDDLYDYQATFSITEAPLFAWKNPEYTWFLITHYTSVLLHRIKTEGGENGRISIVDRTDESFRNCKQKGLAFLEPLSNSLSNFDGFFRCYLLSRSEILENKALFEQLVAGHELFGIHLFIIDKDIVRNNKDLSNTLESLRIIGNAPNKVLDIMVYKDKDGEWGYNNGKDGRLIKNKLSSDKERVVNRFISDLAHLIKSHNSCLIYPTDNYPFKFAVDDVNFNEKKTFLKIQ